MTQPTDVFAFASKAQTLTALKSRLKSAFILPCHVVTGASYARDPNGVITAVQKDVRLEQKLIVRSSRLGEDSRGASEAGRFKSVAGVAKSDGALLKQALDAVFASYGTVRDGDEVLIQSHLDGTVAAGVVFTAEQDTLASYDVINYEDGESLDGVTSGRSAGTKTYVHYSGAPYVLEKFRGLIAACREIQGLTAERALDIEFALRGGDVYVLQVRPLVRDGKRDLSHLDLSDCLEKLHKKIAKLSRPHPSLLGDKAFFGVMTDWNPAEMIGVRPRRLALSLYKELITDNVWAYQRDNYGYRNLRSHPLLVSLMGQPYIDIRASFNSFVPKALDDKIAGRLINHYLDGLESAPKLHDKVEFDIVHSCYYMGLRDKLNGLRGHGFSAVDTEKIAISLRDLTNAVIRNGRGLFIEDVGRIEVLKSRHDEILGSDLSIVDKIYWLAENCKRYGTLPFAGIARAAFIAVQMLNSFRDTGFFSKDEHQAFLATLSTVSRQVSVDLYRLKNGELTREDFLRVYGHLRPGTYDILSPRYDECFELYFSENVARPAEDTVFEIGPERKEALEAWLLRNGLEISADGLMAFIAHAIEQREYAKFVFTRTLSEILRLIARFGEKLNLSRDELSYLDFREIMHLYATLDHRNVRDIFLPSIALNRNEADFAAALRLPGLILRPDDVYHFEVEPEEPNFITLVRRTGHVVAADKPGAGELAGAIAFVASADPGYDFLFSKGIVGLVTQYGGANSHMAIRCAELGIPAVIGAGETYYAAWSKAQVLELDCVNRQVRILR